MVTSPHPAPRRVTILGATGSIGRSAEDVLLRHAERFVVDTVVGGRDAVALAGVARRLRARRAVVADAASAPALAAALAGSGIVVDAGRDAVIDAASGPAEIVVAAIVGMAGLAPTHAALVAGRTVAIANKEPLVAAGDLMLAAAERSGARLLPLDSEHNALFQCLEGHDPATVAALILTASGGPFRTWSREAIAAARPEQALRHPNWSMGAKITIDSATLMNKGLELIEAMHLFRRQPEQLHVLVHPQSAIHGLVTFRDGSQLAALARPDMRLCVAHCLGWPERLEGGVEALDLAALGTLTFEAPDRARFPALALAESAMAARGRAPLVLNAANEVAVAAFLSGALGIYGISDLVAATLDALGTGSAPQDIAEAESLDHDVRQWALERLERLVRAGTSL